MQNRTKYILGATALVGGGALAYRRWQDDEKLQQASSLAKEQVQDNVAEWRGGSTQQARGEEEAPLE